MDYRRCLLCKYLEGRVMVLGDDRDTIFTGFTSFYCLACPRRVSKVDCGCFVLDELHQDVQHLHV